MNFIKPVYAQITNPALSGIAGTEPGAGFAFYVGQLWKTAIVVGGLAFLVYSIMGGINWVTSGGDPKKVETAQKHFTNGVVGLVVLVGTYAIVAFIQEVLGIDILNIDWTFGG